jgi:hypothetical protein
LPSESAEQGNQSPELVSRKRSWKILLTAEIAAKIYAQRPRRGESTGVLLILQSLPLFCWKLFQDFICLSPLYLASPTLSHPDHLYFPSGPSSLEVASRCGVNSKTIRDIWNRETWVRATRSLWTPEEDEAYREALRSKGELSEGAARDEHDDSQVGKPPTTCTFPTTNTFPLFLDQGDTFPCF